MLEGWPTDIFFDEHIAKYLSWVDVLTGFQLLHRILALKRRWIGCFYGLEG